MAIGEQFSGLDMKNLIGAPLGAAADASVQLAHSTADFINTVGFDKNGKTRTAVFKFNQIGKNEDGSIENQEMSVDVPLLAIVPIPNLQIDEVNILFDMEVKQSEQSQSSSDYGGSFSGTANFGIFKATVSGSVSSHSSNTRSSDNSAKYHVDVSATNHGTPEGLARVLDMMAANVAPSIASSTAVDESGNPLVGDRKTKNDTLKKLRLEKSQLETAYSSAQKAFETAISNFKREGMNRQNSYTITIQQEINSAKNGGDANEEKIKSYTEMSQEITECWNNFQNSAKDSIMAVASAAYTDGEQPTVASIFALEGVNKSADSGISIVKFTKESEADALSLLKTNYDRAIDAYKTVLNIKQKLDDTDTKYNETIYGISYTEEKPPAGGDTQQ